MKIPAADVLLVVRVAEISALEAQVKELQSASSKP